MSTSRLADRQIRAAATRAALRLDVRGPVSEALGNAGITVTPDDLEGADLEGADLEDGLGLEDADLGATTREDEAPAKTAGRQPRGLRPTRKPFARDAWPTSRARRSTTKAAPSKTLSGLTADERRVHRILLDALARENRSEGFSNGLSFAEKKHLSVLDLDFIDEELASMGKRRTSRSSASTIALVLGVLFVPVLALIAVQTGPTAAVLLGVMTAAAVLGIHFASTVAASGTPGPREQIYRALRELALLVDDAPVSAALERADSLIDHFAGADEASSRAVRPAQPTGPSRPTRRTPARS